VLIAGQEPEDEDGNLVGAGDLATQAGQVFANVGRAGTATIWRVDQQTRTLAAIRSDREQAVLALHAGDLLVAQQP
jgi:enamine deaminase RidA (YjgF/YER057c/UK114 family)